MAKLTYRDAGVDLDVYHESMSRLPRLLARTQTPRVMPLPGGFAGLFRLDFGGGPFARNYREPVLVACTDGVGTKLKVASLAGVHNTVGIDLVAMCVNDALCCGAEPLFFLDYVAMPKDDPALLEQIVEGITAGCVASDAALLGGETAILPDVYAEGDYDLAGFCVGVVERERVLDGSAIAAGDVVLGLASSGLHSNGYSLARKVVFDHAGLKVDEHVAALDCSVGAALLEPTRIYARPLRRLLGELRERIHAAAHITGGGLAENLSRVVPGGIRIRLRRGSWSIPPVFSWLQGLGPLDLAEMEGVFNMGLGLVLVLDAAVAEAAQRHLAEEGIESWAIGHVEEGPRGVLLVDG